MDETKKNIEINGGWVNCWFIGGPSDSTVAWNHSSVETAIKTLCENTGDDPEDYTVTKSQLRFHPDVFKSSSSSELSTAEEDKAAFRTWFDDYTLMLRMNGGHPDEFMADAAWNACLNYVRNKG